MKKIILGTALLAMIAAPIAATADTTVYGRMRYSFSMVNEDDGGNLVDGIVGSDNTSLFGVKGTYGDSVKAFFDLQTGANADAAAGRAFSQRYYFAGLSGGFGKVAYGRMSNIYKAPGSPMDPFLHFSHTNVAGVWAPTGATHGLSPANNGFTDNALQYESPSLAGIRLAGGIYVDDTNEDGHGYAARATYSIAGLTVGACYGINDDLIATLPGIDADGDAIRGYVTYTMDMFNVGVSYEDIDIAGDGTDDKIGYLFLAGTITIPNSPVSIAASIGNASDGAAEGTSLNVGAFYAVAENTKLFLIAGMADLDNQAAVGTDGTTPYSFSLGAEHKFSLSSK